MCNILCYVTAGVAVPVAVRQLDGRGGGGDAEVCVCVCVCAKQSEGDRRGDEGMEGEGGVCVRERALE